MVIHVYKYKLSILVRAPVFSYHTFVFKLKYLQLKTDYSEYIGMKFLKDDRFAVFVIRSLTLVVKIFLSLSLSLTVNQRSPSDVEITIPPNVHLIQSVSSTGSLENLRQWHLVKLTSKHLNFK